MQSCEVPVLKTTLERFFTAASHLQCKASPVGSSAGRRLLQIIGESEMKVALSMPMANVQPPLLATIANTNPQLFFSILLMAEHG